MGGSDLTFRELKKFQSASWREDKSVVYVHLRRLNRIAKEMGVKTTEAARIG